MNVLLSKNFYADAVIGANLIVKHSAADDRVVQAAAATDKLIGISDNFAPALNERCDVIVHGIGDVICGGAVTRGDPITSDANGKAVTAAPAAGANNRTIGIAMASGVAGDIIPVLISPGMVQG